MSDRPWSIVGVRVEQVGPDTWETAPCVLRVHESTTIGEIREWARRRRLLAGPGAVSVLTLSMDEEPKS